MNKLRTFSQEKTKAQHAQDGQNVKSEYVTIAFPPQSVNIIHTVLFNHD